MSSRKEQKEQLRREREAREAAEREAARRRQLIGYAAGAAVVILALATAGFLLMSSDDGGGGKETSADVLPDGGEVPAQQITDLEEAAKAASCELKSFPGKQNNRLHTEDLSETIEYDSNPPTQGRHFVQAAEDGSYEEAPDVKQIVHTLEHGRVVVWFQKGLPAQQRANLKALFDEDTYQMVLVPNETNMPYKVAASAWNADPTPEGTGRLLGCDSYNEKIFDAIRAFKDEHRSRGPEPVP